jgi:fibro-slime domain-containing protein
MFKHIALASVASVVGGLAVQGSAIAGQPLLGGMAASYFTFANGDQDTGGAQCCSTSTITSNSVVLSTLGPDGLPLYNPAYIGPNGGLSDVNSNGELTWWSPADNANVSALAPSASLPAIVPVPFNTVTDYFVPGQGGDSPDYLMAKFTTTLILPSNGNVTFNLASDDDTFLYVDGKLVDENGGVHAIGSAISNTLLLGGGSHSMVLFYADRDNVQAGLVFSGSFSAVPEPATWALMLAGFAGLGGAALRRKNVTGRAIA